MSERRMAIKRAPARSPASSAREGAPRAAADAANETADFLDDYLPYLLGHASWVMNKDFDDYVRAAGLSPVEWRTLATLHDRDGLTIGELCRIVVAQQPTLTKAVKRLSEVGLARREDDEGDLRKTRVFRTVRGRKVTADLITRALEHEQALVGGLGAEELRLLKRALRQILARRAPPARIA